MWEGEADFFIILRRLTPCAPSGLSCPSSPFEVVFCFGFSDGWRYSAASVSVWRAIEAFGFEVTDTCLVGDVTLVLEFSEVGAVHNDELSVVGGKDIITIAVVSVSCVGFFNGFAK